MEYIHKPALYLLSTLFLLGAQARITGILTPDLHARTNAQTTQTRDAELVRPLLRLSPWAHQRVVGAMMGALGCGMLVPDLNVKRWSVILGIGMNLWGFANRWRAGLDVTKFSAAWVVLVDAVVVMVSMES